MLVTESFLRTIIYGKHTTPLNGTINDNKRFSLDSVVADFFMYYESDLIRT
jgi:hypothetical protein